MTSVLQQSLPLPITIIDKNEILDAWQWFLQNMSPRPSIHCNLCIFDLKVWGSQTQPLSPGSQITEVLAKLYLVGELEDVEIVLDLVKNNNSQDLILPPGQLDDNIKKVVKNEKRFRNHLSEHLAFWVRLAVAVQSGNSFSDFACSRPHIIPEDHGPDGVFIGTGKIDKIEVQSVKNSISNPQKEISTQKFRQSGYIPNSKPKQLEEFYKLVKENFGLVQLDRELADLLRVLKLSAEKTIRMGLVADCAYNAVVVADHQYAKIELFEGYNHVTHDVERRIATYIGSTEWTAVAEETRKFVLKTLKKGVGAF